jgi:hypothetical protein
MNHYLCYVAILFAPINEALRAAELPVEATIIEVRRIADDAPHSAFTDLIRFNGQFICAFRQGRSHVSTDGRITVLASSDGETWSKAAELKHPDFDLRDASLSITPDGSLMLVGGASPRKQDNESAPTGTFVAFSADARTWTEPQIIVEPGRWLWRTTWHEGQAFGVSYAAGATSRVASLMVSDNGREFREAVPNLLDEGWPTEAVIRFADDGTAYCLQRRDGTAPANSAYLGVSRAPYTQWTWKDLGIYFGGPNLTQSPRGRWIAAGRIVRDGNSTTDLASLDVESNELVPLLTLPSGGDTSYPGLAWHDDVLWVSYYSSHEGKAMIYVAQVRIDELNF